MNLKYRYFSCADKRCRSKLPFRIASRQSPHIDELDTIACQSSLTVHRQETESMGRLSMQYITSVVGDNPANATVSFCGPAKMREDLKEAFQRAGLKAGSFSYEMFELR